MKQTLLSILLMLLPLMAWADDNGSCGNSINYTYTAETHTLTISGQGEMSGYSTISRPWESYKDDIQSIVVEEGVTSIGCESFKDLSSLTSISFPTSLQFIQGCAFKDCVSITTINIPNGVSIVDGAFMGCSSLTSVTLPSDLYSIDSFVFQDCINLETITLPSITSFGVCAFKGCTNLRSIVIPESVTSIGSGAFQDCDNLTSVEIKVKIPIAISENVFTNRTNATLSVPYGCKTAYENATYWSEFNIINQSDNDSGSCGDGVTYSYVEATHTLTISKTSDGTGAMNNYGTTNTPWVTYRDKITQIIIEEGVTCIGKYSFYQCSNLINTTISNSVTSIDRFAFQYCSSLISISIPNSVTSIGNSAFRYCSGLTSVSIPNSVTSIGSSAFLECTDLSSVTIPNSVTSIGDHAFLQCTGLTSVFISDISAWCDISFKTMDSNPLNYAQHLYLNGDEIENLIIPDGVTSISNFAFSGCTGLTSVTIPNSVTSIGDYAFSECTGLTSVFISDISAWCDISFKTMDSNPLNYAQHLYLNGNEIENLIIPDGVTSIGNFAFSGCTDLTSVTIPNSVTSIGEAAFDRCSGLTSLVLSDYLTIIMKESFQSCSALTSLTIPSSVQYIYQNAFNGCSALEEINAQPTTPPFIYNNTFPNYTVPVNVPSGCKGAYQTADNWSNFTTINDGNVYYTLSITADDHGTVTYSETNVSGKTETFNVIEGANVTLTFTPASNYALTTLTVDGVDKLADVSDGSLTISNVTANTTVIAAFSYAGDVATVTITDAGVATFCSDKDLDFSEVPGLRAYTGAGFNTSTGNLVLLEVTDVPAGTGLLVKGAAGSYEIPSKASASIYANLLVGVTSATALSQTDGGYTNYILGKKSDVVGFYKVDDAGGDLPAGKAYLRIPTPTAGARMTIALDFSGDTTGIDEIGTDSTQREAWFDLQGRRMEAAPVKAGLYIRNGKKFIVH